jgi:transposase InsO family protein
VTPVARRAAVTAAQEAHGISERLACSIIDADRGTVRIASAVGTMRGLKEFAAERRRFGWRRLRLLLEREEIRMNHKKLRRVYAEERLQVRRRGGRKRALGTRAPMNTTTRCGGLPVCDSKPHYVRHLDGQIKHAIQAVGSAIVDAQPPVTPGAPPRTAGTPPSPYP